MSRLTDLLGRLGGGDSLRGSALAIGIAVGVFGVSFGVLARASGLSLWQTQAMSLLVFTGASQFAAVGIVEGGGSAAAALSTGLLLAARNGLYGLALSSLLRVSFARRLLATQLVIDETTAMALAQPEPADARRAFWLTGVAVFVSWNLGTLVGALGGGAIDDPAALGLDVVFPASFLALVAPQLREGRARAVAALAAAIALVLVPLTPAGVPILAAASAALLGLLARSARS